MVLLSVVFTVADNTNGIVRSLPHTQALPMEEAPEGELVTHLPIVRVDTDGAPIPYVDNDGTPMDGLPAGTPLDTACTMEVISQEGVWHTDTDTPELTTAATIRIRGNSSRHFDKKSYLVKLYTDNRGDDRAAEVMGMSAAGEWVLNGPFLDRTLMRNYLCYSVAGQAMDFAPDLRFCELILNGEYRGIYLMTEAVTKGEGRVDLTEPEQGRAMTSWLVRWDRESKAEVPLDNFTHYTLQSGVSGLDLCYPGKHTVTPERVEYVETEISQIERAIYSADFQDPVKGYAAYLDETAFARYFVLNEFFGNVDAGRFSTYYYKDVRGKVTPVVWDFNNAADNYIDYVYDNTGFNMTQSPWFGRLLQDEEFVRQVVAQYRAMRKDILSDAYLTAFIDETAAYLGDAVDRNYEVWGYVFQATAVDDVNYLHPLSRNYRSYDEAVEQLKTWLTKRGDWMDQHIETLYQYCRDSKNAARIEQ